MAALPSNAERIAEIDATVGANPNIVADIEHARAAKDAIKGMFCGIVERLETLAPRRIIMSALRDALQTEQTVDEMIAAADAE